MCRPHEIEKSTLVKCLQKGLIDCLSGVAEFGRQVVPNSSTSSSKRSVTERTVAARYEADTSLSRAQGSPSRVGHEPTVVSSCVQNPLRQSLRNSRSGPVLNATIVYMNSTSLGLLAKAAPHVKLIS